MSEIDLNMLRRMRSSTVRNYAIPGLTSWIIGAKHEGGCVRMFHSSRRQQQDITPHSHRFDFQCWVLSGSVKNRTWVPDSIDGDTFTMSTLIYGALGKYERDGGNLVRYRPIDREYVAGEWYSMRSSEIHSIFFGKDTEVLFFEGPTVSNQSKILEPYADNKTIPTFKVEPWMFERVPA